MATFKTVLNQRTPPTQKKVFTANHFSFSNVDGNSAGRRARAFFLCPLTGEYGFYFSCATSCEWSIKESELSGSQIAGGASSQAMDEGTFNS